MTSEVDIKTQREEVLKNIGEKILQGNYWYLISSKWFDSWKDFVDYNEKGTKGEIPGPIDNEPLLLQNEDILRQDVKENTDFVLVPEKIGKLLHKIYGGKEIKRQVIVDSSKEFVELYPYVLLISLNQENLNFVKKTYSKKTKLNQILQDLKSFYNVKDDVRLWLSFNSSPYRLFTLENESQEIESLITRILGQQLVLEVKINNEWPLESKSKPRSIQFINSKDQSPMTSKRSQVELKGNFQKGIPGVVGLSNLGNTCFMNSSLQCLSKVPQLYDYFIKRDWKKEINVQNPLGMEGKIANVFADLMKEIWSGNHSVIIPRDFKDIIGRFQSMFSGSNQQDSQEFLSYLMDGLHEDLNRIVKKPKSDPPPRQNKSDEEYSKEFWKTHLERNNSVFTDKIQGQYKSTLICPGCDKVSITFDPFMTLSLPLPKETHRIIPATLFKFKNNERPILFKVKVPKNGTVKDLRKAISEFSKIEESSIVLADIYHSKVFKYFPDTLEIQKVLPTDKVVAYEIPNIPQGTHEGYSYVDEEKEPPFISVRLYSIDKETERSFSVSIMGTPLTIPWKSQFTNRQIYDICLTYIKRYLKDLDKSGYDLSKPETLFLQEEESTMKPLFTLRYEQIIMGSDRTLSKMLYNDEVFQIPSRLISEKKTLSLFVSKDVINNHINQTEFLGEVIDPSVTGLSLDQKPLDIQDLFKLFTKQEILDKDNEWYCGECKKHVQASKKLDIWRLPDVLIVHLKRFMANERFGQYLEKIETSVDFPLELDLKEYSVSKQKECEYQLIGVVNHFGNISGGHYTSNVKVEDKWFNFDDSNTKEIQNPVSSSAYVLFYVNKNLPKETEVKGLIYPKEETQKSEKKILESEEKEKLDLSKVLKQ